MSWLTNFAEQAAHSDQLKDHENHLALLCSGLFGEAGSVVAELKKQQREKEAYPHYRNRLEEELGDFLWYFARVTTLCDRALLGELSTATVPKSAERELSEQSLAYAAEVGIIMQCIRDGRTAELRTALLAVWSVYSAIASKLGISLEGVAKSNLAKIQSRWPAKREFHALLDEDCLPEEQIPRTLAIEFLQRNQRDSSRVEVILRYKGVNIGDRLTDNISEPDAYRFHDIFHIAYAVFLGWSPVTRSLLRCKRKSRPAVDENEDGARAAIVEEAVSAIVFSRAKHMDYFKGATQIDYDLLKSIQEFIRGFQVEQIPVWQWERAILEGFRAFRQLRDGPGGVISWDLREHRLDWSPVKSG